MPEVNFEVNPECRTNEKGLLSKATLRTDSLKLAILPCMRLDSFCESRRLSRG